MTRPGLAASATVALLAVAGCGDGRLDSGELRERVTAACAKASKELELVPEPTGDRDIGRFVTRAGRITETLRRELSGLKPPEDAQQGYSSAVGLVREQAQAFGAAKRKLDGGGDPLLVLRRLADQSTELNAREKTAWGAVGVESCATR